VANPAPAFSFYAKDFIAGTLTLSLAERGAYITLLAYQWDNGSVPDDARERCRVLGCTRREADAIWPRIVDKFERNGDAWLNVRLEKERAKQAERRAALAENGKRGGRPRNQKDKQTKTNSFRSGLVNTNQNESLSSSSSSSIPSLKTTREYTRAADEPRSVEAREGDSVRAGDFVEWYRAAHQRLIGVAYMGHPRHDYDAALRLVATFQDKQIQDAAIVWFGMDDDFATSGTRTIPKFASRASKCVELARKVAS
jgi:uncharacterized protein YdaU (DUF1376 family)